MKFSLLATTLIATVALNGCTKKAEESKTTETTPAVVESQPAETTVSAPTSAPEAAVDTTTAPASEVASAPVSGEVATLPAATETKESFEQTLTTNLASVDAKIAELTAKIEARGEAAKKALEADLVDLKAKREPAAGELAKLKGMTADTWASLKDATKSAFDQLEVALKKAEDGLAAH